MKLTQVRIVGRYKMPNGRSVKVRAGRVVGRDYERLFYIRDFNTRVFIDDSEFYNEWVRDKKVRRTDPYRDIYIYV